MEHSSPQYKHSKGSEGLGSLCHPSWQQRPLTMQTAALGVETVLRHHQLFNAATLQHLKRTKLFGIIFTTKWTLVRVPLRLPTSIRGSRSTHSSFQLALPLTSATQVQYCNPRKMLDAVQDLEGTDFTEEARHSAIRPSSLLAAHLKSRSPATGPNCVASYSAGRPGAPPAARGIRTSVPVKGFKNSSDPKAAAPSRLLR